MSEVSMKETTIICSVTILLFVTAVLGVPPAWSAPDDKKPEIQKPDKKATKESGALKDGGKGKTRSNLL